MEKPIDSKPTRDWLLDKGREVGGPTPPSTAPTATVTPGEPPSGFPSNLTVSRVTFTDWSTYISVPDVLMARVENPADVVDVCNWAVANGHTVRAVGHSHNWSPLVLAHDTAPGAKIMLVDTSKLDSCSFEPSSGNLLATFGTGITLDAASKQLEGFDNGGAGLAPGYAFPQLPAPGNLSLGGALAIGAHGTVVPSGVAGENTLLMSCLSNLVTAFDAVVTDPTGSDPHTYAIRHFERDETDSAAFLVHLGRAFITSVTLLVEPNYYLQLHCLFPDATDLFAAPGTPPKSGNPQFASLLDDYGRIEVLWFPYNTGTFVQCNRRQSTKNDDQVDGPYNYPWMNDITATENWLIKQALFHEPSLTPKFTEGEYWLAKWHEHGVVLNGTARDLEIYLHDTTLKVTLFGWALQIPRAEVQDVASRFFQQLRSMLARYEQQGVYPINAAAEIRCNTVDQMGAVPWNDAPPPALAATRSVAPSDEALDTVIWLNVGTITGTPGSNEFYTELETWILETWGNETPDRLRPEWSKAWAYTENGPWTNAAVLDRIRSSYNQPAAAPFTMDWAADTLAKYDGAGLFTSPLLDTLFAPR